MTGLQIALSIILIIIAAALIIVVLLQKNREAGANAVTGGQSSSFFDKTKGHQKDAALATATKVLGILFGIFSVATVAVLLFV